MQIEVLSSDAMQQLGAKIGALVRGGETIELVGDIGAGKTTFTKGLASGMGIDEDIQSPTFTISRVYEAPNGLVLAHYDFYRLNDPGIMRAELDESVHDAGTVTVIEWAEVVADVLPADTLRIVIRSTSEESRAVTVVGSGAKSREIAREIT